MHIVDIYIKEVYTSIPFKIYMDNLKVGEIYFLGNCHGNNFTNTLVTLTYMQIWFERMFACSGHYQ